MPLFSKLARFASSPQGRRLTNKAMAYAQSPQGKARIDKVRKQIAAKGSSSKPKPR